MKKNIFLLLITAALANYAHAQCDKEISTNPFNPFNDEFLPLMNDWFESDDPSTPIYTVNSFVNSAINWYPGNGIQLDLNEGWQHDFGNANNYSMTNPFANNHNQTHLWLPSNNENERDFRWEDGWELLWMNIGKSPNGDPYSSPSQGTYFAHGNQNASNGNYVVNPDAINPSNIPYFVLYNRYRGVIRLFANVWQGGSTGTQGQEWAVTMKYTTDDFLDQNISGIFRHASSIDRALDQPTEHTAIIGPRTQTINQSNWAVAEFPMAFDPCICMKEKDPLVSKDPGRIEFLFEIIETSAIDLYSRSIEVEQEITAATLNDDFLNLSETNEDDFKPGSAMYREMGDMFTKYQSELDKYNDDLEDYNTAWNSTKYQLLDIAKNFVSSGINLTIPAGGLFEKVLDGEAFEGADDANEITNDAIKGLVGSGVDYASMEIFGKKPNKPVKPTAPLASFRETNYKGKLTRTFYQRTPPLLIPGGINADFIPSSIDPSLSSLPTQMGYGETQLYTSIFPAYNKLLGTSALLKIPNTQFQYDSDFAQATPSHNEGQSTSGIYYCYVDKEIVGTTVFNLRLDDLEVALNRSLDFDFEKTKTYVRIEVQMRNRVPPINSWLDVSELHTLGFYDALSNSNMHLSHEFPIQDEGTRRIYSSKWVPLEEVNQHIFSLQILDKAIYSGLGFSWTSGDCDIHDPFNPSFISQELESVRMKILQDNYFEQIGYLEEQVNTTQVTSYFLFNAEENINYLGDQGNWNAPQSGVFDQYLPGLITLGYETITTSHPLVHEVIGNEIFINAQEVQITGPIQVEPGYTLVVQALEQIQSIPGAGFNPNVHLRIKKDFYNTPVFEYADNAAVYNFCNDNRAYQANTASRALQERIEQERELEEAFYEEAFTQKTNRTSLTIYPNPARNELTIQTQGAGIDRLTIFDTATRPVMQASPGGQSLYRMDISSLAPGVYIVQANSGGEVLTEKLVVAR